MPKSPTPPDDRTPNRWPTATPSIPEMSWDSDSGGRFSNSDESAVEEIEEIVDLTLPTPSPKKKKLITKCFKPNKRLPQSGGTPYFLQRYNPQPAPAFGLATGQSSTPPPGWKGLDKQLKEKSTLKKKRKKKSGVGRPITYEEDLSMSLYQWVLEMHDLHLPVHNAQIK